ncbi:hypothetical protein LG943_08535 [Streptomonospora sp. S1-112]|uniref:Uncharacterized protein n=1 Tax=Streptomonospora mangrovi TaxID=2883123 RepID=A0A9X3SDX5_9ACTN|nr:hypothetical protein [Streptomonospora mangrovi]MDA0564372.1 hypothetical protein [Streptomonospora mangrovi]
MNDTHPPYPAPDGGGQPPAAGPAPSPSGRPAVPSAPAPRGRARRLAAAVGGRWPTYLGVAIAVVSTEEDPSNAAMIAFLAALTYLATAVAGRPLAVWPILVALLLLARGAEFLGVDHLWVTGPLAVAVAVAGLINGRLLEPGLYRWQLPQMAAVAAVVLAAEYAGLSFAGYLVAAVLLGHAAWDVVHWRADRVVHRPLAEFCAVLDFLLAVGLVVLLAV